VTVVSGADISNTAIGTDRPNATGASVALGRGWQDPEQFFNTDVFVLQPVGTLGNVGRNTLIGLGIINWDFSTLKDFRIREGQELQFRFETFNLPNHPNWGLPDTSRLSPGFGKIHSTRTDMRDLNEQRDDETKCKRVRKTPGAIALFGPQELLPPTGPRHRNRF
jgi:hypothetical protein